MVNILFSGIDKKEGFTKQQSEVLIKYIENNKSIAFIASDFSDNNKTQLNYDIYINIFHKININFNNSYLIDNRLSISQVLELLKKVDYIFLMGGNPELQMKSILEYNIEHIIKEKKVIIGVSAGSMNQSKRVIYKDDFENYKLKDYKGLGLVNINIFPHIDLDSKKLLNEAIELSYKIPLIMLPNDSFIVVNNKIIEYYGKYYFVFNGNIELLIGRDIS